MESSYCYRSDIILFESGNNKKISEVEKFDVLYLILDFPYR